MSNKKQILNYVLQLIKNNNVVVSRSDGVLNGLTPKSEYSYYIHSKGINVNLLIPGRLEISFAEPLEIENHGFTSVREFKKLNYVLDIYEEELLTNAIEEVLDKSRSELEELFISTFIT